MALPQNYHSTKEYFKDCLNFFEKYQWLFYYPNTHILSKNVFENFPRDWTEYFKNISAESLKDIAIGDLNAEYPDTLKQLIGKMQSLTPCYKLSDVISEIDSKSTKISKKKFHEINYVAPIIHNKCLEFDINHVIDIGSGLGYLPNMLHEKYNYKVLGIESNDKYVEAANKNCKTSDICYRQHFVTENSDVEIKNLIEETFCESGDVCVTALHACADLTIDILKMIKEMKVVKCAVILPCCYHRIKGSDDAFLNFPLSEELKLLYGNYDRKFLNRPFLRLACQQTNSMWNSITKEDLDIQARNCLFRNILQEVVDGENISISRQKRKTGSKQPSYSIEKFVEDLSTYYKFYKDGSELDKEELDCIKSFTALQNLIQGVCENLVLLDRCCYMMENGFDCVTEKLTDDVISPRCKAFIVTRI